MDLGVVVAVENPEFAEAVFTKVKQAGFDFGLVNFIWSPLTQEIVESVSKAAVDSGFSIRAVGCPANLLRLSESSSSGSDETDLAVLIQNLPLFADCQYISLWSGTYAKKLMGANLLNQGDNAFFAMSFELQVLLDRAAYSQIKFAIMPCYAHVLHDVATSLRLTDEFTDGRVGLNLDPAFLISPTNYSKRHQILPRIATVLAPGAAIISLSDILVRDTTMSYPAIGSGGIDFKSLIATLTENADQNAVWVLNAHPLWGVDELASIKNRVVSMLQTDLTEAGSSEPEA